MSRCNIHNIQQENSLEFLAPFLANNIRKLVASMTGRYERDDKNNLARDCLWTLGGRKVNLSIYISGSRLSVDVVRQKSWNVTVE